MQTISGAGLAYSNSFSVAASTESRERWWECQSAAPDVFRGSYTASNLKPFPAERRACFTPEHSFVSTKVG